MQAAEAVAGQQDREARVDAELPVIPIRDQPDVEDHLDQKRVDLVLNRWESQDMAALPYMRMVEEHVRMLSGRQWDVWSELLGRYVDPLRWMSDEERRWRQRPTMDYLGYWFMVTLSKVTENQPIVGWLPADLDELSARLAEAMDPISKKLWDECELNDRLIAACAWVLCGGEAFLMTRPDYEQGEEQELIGPAVLKMEREGMDPIERVIEAAPYSAEGEPLAQLVPGDDGLYEGYEVTGDPHKQKKGKLRVDVCSPLEIRAEWGTNIPWNEKRWVIHRWFLPPDAVYDRWGVTVQPNVYPDHGEEATPDYLERMLFGSGYFGSVRSDIESQNTSTNKDLIKGYVCGYTMWEKPSAEFKKGRLLVIGNDKVLHDSARPFEKLECAGPIRKIEFVNIPGRPRASTPLEKMVPLQKRLNRVEAQIAEHTNLCTNPVLLVHASAGIDPEDFEARPGLVLEYDGENVAVPAQWLAPPSLGSDVWRHKEAVREQLFIIGSITGNEGSTPTQSASGELVQQLRFNSDRPLAPMTRSIELATAGVFEDMLAIIPSIWTEEEIIHYAGDDNTVRTMTILPEIFEGSVSARPVMESAAPESREARQQRITELFSMGAWGDPKSADPAERQRAITRFLELSRFPDITRAAKPGGVHRMMAEHNLGRLVRGEPAESIPLLRVYDYRVHVEIVENFMAGPDYLSQDPAIQEEIDRFLGILETAEVEANKFKIERMANLAAMDAAAGAVVATAGGTPPVTPGAEGGDAGDSQGALPGDAGQAA